MSLHEFAGSKNESRVIETRWTEDQEQYLVQLYQQRPCLWKHDSPSYLDYCARRQAYKAIHEQLSDLGVTLVEVMMKLRELRKAYVNELRKMFQTQTVNVPYQSRYAWFNQLNLFLYGHLYFDEYEIVEASLRDSCYGSYFSEEDGPNERRNVYTGSNDGLSYDITTSRPSCRLSTTTFSSSVNSQQPQNELIEKTKSLSVPRFQGTFTRRTRSDPIGGCAVIVNEWIQPIKINEKSILPKFAHSNLTVRKSLDQFDLFAKRVAYQLKRMNSTEAAKAQMKIQKILTTITHDVESNNGEE